MTKYKENYGQDIDGNRGVDIWLYELEPTDRPYVQDALESLLARGEEIGYMDEVEICIDDILFTITPSEWYTNKQWEEINEGFS